jgi:glycosyltransferase involved in cell wall biosynthesis
MHCSLPPVNDGISMSNPLITFVVCAYNQEQFIREAVAAALDQTYSPLEVILSDDCSPDRTFEIMQEMAAAYRGPHQVVLNKNPKNLGVGGHVNRIFELSRGELVVGAAGDDISFKDRTERVYRAWVESSQTAFSIYSNMIVIDSIGSEKGVWNDGSIASHPPSCAVAVAWGDAGVYGCSHAFHRKTFDIFGPMDDRVVHEDEAIPFRSLLLGTIKYLDEPLVYYRRHENNLWTYPSTAPTLQKRCQILSSDWSYLVSWLRDLRRAGFLGIIAHDECERLQQEVVERLREKSVESQFYNSPLPAALLVLFREYLGRKTFRQMIRLLKRRWQSERAACGHPRTTSQLH